MPTKDGIVFISCGQYTNAEKTLGKALAQAVTDLTPFEGYFAENQSDLNGLSRNILDALRGCAGFVAVMHNRGRVETPAGNHVRASVWIEQEIAIAAFLRQSQDRRIEVAVYAQKGIKREGLREQLHLNPIEFDSEDEVLSDFKARIVDGRFRPTPVPSMPLVREETIPTRILLNLGPGTLIPHEPPSPSRSGSHMFKAELQTLGRVAFEPLFRGSTDPILKETIVLSSSDRPTTKEAGAQFAGEMLQWVLFRMIDLLHHSSTEFIHGSHRNAIIPPESVVYPNGELAAAASANTFSKVGQEPMLYANGWQVRVPKGTVIRFGHQYEDSSLAPTYIIEFSNPLLYVIRFSAYVSNTYSPTTSRTPENEGSASIQAYEFTIKCYFEFHRSADTDPFQLAEYETWAKEVFSGLREMISMV